MADDNSNRAFYQGAYEYGLKEDDDGSEDSECSIGYKPTIVSTKRYQASTNLTPTIC